MNGSRPATSVVAKRLTPAGRGAVACIALRGPRSELALLELPFSPANGLPMAEQAPGRICFGKWGRGAAEEIVLTRLSEENWEIHCHGGEAAVRRILADLALLGVAESPCPSGSWIDSRWLESHCYDVALAAKTARTAEIALRQAGGCLRAGLETIRGLFSRDETDLDEPLRRLDAILRWSEVGRHLATPWNVVIAGRPNVGKSSLMNALLGYGRSIVVDLPGTTRDIVTAETAIDGWSIMLTDTAGIRATSDALEAEGVRRAEQQITTADLVIHVHEAADFLTGEPATRIRSIPGSLVVWNKIDQMNRKYLPPPDGLLLTSAVTGDGVEMLCRVIVERLVPRAPGPHDAVPAGDAVVRRLEAVRQCLRNRKVADASALLNAMLEDRFV